MTSLHLCMMAIMSRSTHLSTKEKYNKFQVSMKGLGSRPLGHLYSCRPETSTLCNNSSMRYNETNLQISNGPQTALYVVINVSTLWLFCICSCRFSTVGK